MPLTALMWHKFALDHVVILWDWMSFSVIPHFMDAVGEGAAACYPIISTIVCSSDRTATTHTG